MCLATASAAGERSTPTPRAPRPPIQERQQHRPGSGAQIENVLRRLVLKKRLDETLRFRPGDQGGSGNGETQAHEFPFLGQVGVRLPCCTPRDQGREPSLRLRRQPSVGGGRALCTRGKGDQQSGLAPWPIDTGIPQRKPVPVESPPQP